MKADKMRAIKKKRKVVILLIAILIIVASIIFYIVRSNMTDLEEIENFEYDNNIIDQNVTENSLENELNAGVEIVDVSVLGKIVLDKIGIDCYIFDTNSKAEREKALKVGTVRFYGPDVNEPRKFMHRRS